YVPKALKYLGVENYGIWATILSILSWISFFDVGIGNSLRTKLVEYLEKKQEKEARELISTAYINIGLISLGIFLISLIILKFVDMQSLLNINYKKLNELIFLAFCFINFNFVISLCKPIYYAQQKSTTVSLIELTSQTLNFLGILLFIHIKLNNSLIYICLLYGITSLGTNLFYTYKLFKSNRNILPRISDYKKEMNKQLNTLGFKFFLLQIVCLILFTTDSVIITKLFGASEVTPYNLSNRIFGIIISLYSIILTPLWSRVSKEKANGNIKWIKNTLLKLNYLSLIVAIGIIILYKIYPFISEIWLQQNIEYPDNLIMYMAVFSFLSIWCNNYAYIMNGMGEIDLQVKLAI
ncbi:MAG: lipopolysaccharide biosynthesis protein, partial [Cetobacterium sp.]